MEYLEGLDLEPGRHNLRITRLGFESFERTFTIVEARDVVMETTWKQLTAAEPPKPKVTIPPEKPKPKPTTEPPGTSKEPPPKKPDTVPTKEPSKPPRPILTEEERRALEAAEKLEKKYQEATQGAEKLAGQWDFHGALAELTKVSFDERELAKKGIFKPESK